MGMFSPGLAALLSQTRGVDVYSYFVDHVEHLIS